MSWNWLPFNSVAIDNTTCHKPMTSVELLRSLYGDKELSDVKLQGSDGGTVVGVKAILAARSPLFRKIFFGTITSTDIILSKGKRHIIFKEWDCCILHLLIEFCYTDSITVMDEQPSDHLVRLMVNLKFASIAFGLDILTNKVNDWNAKQVGLFPALACALIDESMKRGEIDNISLVVIRTKSKAALLPGSNAIGAGVESLTEPTLLFVLRTLEDLVSQRLLTAFIQRWADFSNSDNGKGINHVKETMLRKSFAKKCSVRFVKFSNSDECISQNSEISLLTSHPFAY